MASKRTPKWSKKDIKIKKNGVVVGGFQEIWKFGASVLKWVRNGVAGRNLIRHGLAGTLLIRERVAGRYLIRDGVAGRHLIRDGGGGKTPYSRRGFLGWEPTLLEWWGGGGSKRRGDGLAHLVSLTIYIKLERLMIPQNDKLGEKHNLS